VAVMMVVWAHAGEGGGLSLISHRAAAALLRLLALGRSLCRSASHPCICCAACS